MVVMQLHCHLVNNCKIMVAKENNCQILTTEENNLIGSHGRTLWAIANKMREAVSWRDLGPCGKLQSNTFSSFRGNATQTERYIYRVFQKKITQSLRHHNSATVCHKLVRFSTKCSEKNCLHDRNQCLDMTIKYSLFCSWQVNYTKTKLTTS